MGDNEFLMQRPLFPALPEVSGPPRGLGGLAVEAATPEVRHAVTVLDDARSRITIGSAIILLSTLYAMTVA